MDVLVLTDPSLNPAEVRDSLSDLLYDILLEEGELISVIVVSEDHFENYNLPVHAEREERGDDRVKEIRDLCRRKPQSSCTRPNRL